MPNNFCPFSAQKKCFCMHFAFVIVITALSMMNIWFKLKGIIHQCSLWLQKKKLIKVPVSRQEISRELENEDKV